MNATTETLRNGAQVLDRRRDIVLAYWANRAYPFVTWAVDDLGNAFWGRYFLSLAQAAEDFERRAS